VAYQHQHDHSNTTITAIYAIALIFALMVMFGLLSSLQRPEEGATNTPAPPPTTGKPQSMEPAMLPPSRSSLDIRQEPATRA
jgi:hypothetical protein